MESEDKQATYNMEYGVETKEDFNAYKEFAAPRLQEDIKNRFDGKFSAERLFYKIIYETFL